MTIDERVSRLERESRNWRRVAVGLAALLGLLLSCAEHGAERNGSGQAGAAIGADPEKVYDKLRVRELEVVNADGQLVGQLISTPSCGYLNLHSAGGTVAIDTKIMPGSIYLQNGEQKSLLTSNFALWNKEVAGKKYKSVVSIGTDDSGGGYVQVYDGNGKLASELNVGLSDGGRMTVYNALGKEAASMQANKKNEGMVVVNNVNGETGNWLTVR